MPRSLNTTRHFWTSFFRCAAASSGVFAMISTLRSRQRCTASGVRRLAGGRREHVPGREFVAGQPRFRERRYLRRDRRALEGCHAKRAQPLRFDQRQRVGYGVREEDRRFAAHCGSCRGAAAFVVHREHVDLAHIVQKLGGDMRIGRRARGTIAQRAGARFGERDQLAHVLHGQRRVHDQQRVDRRHDRDRREIGNRIERHRAVDELVRDERQRVEHQRVAVWRCVFRKLGADVA